MNTEFHIMPEQASSFAYEVDLLYAFLVLVSGIMTVLIAGLIIFFAIRYRRGSPANRDPGHGGFLMMEIGWIVGPFILTMIMFFWGAKIFFDQTRAPPDAMELTAVGKQWMWKFQHPEGHSEINDLHVPLNQAIKINMISEDVIHSLYIPAFRIKQDVLPGRYSSVWFKPTMTGRFHLFCAEYCGAKHSEMGGWVYVMEASDYQEWLSGNKPEQSMAQSGRRLFDELRCGSCHLPAGQQGRGPSLANLYGSEVPLQNGQKVLADDNYLRESIIRPAAKIVAGYPNIMPSFEGQVNEEGLLQLLAEIKSMAAPLPAATPVPSGQEQVAPTAPSAPEKDAPVP